MTCKNFRNGSGMNGSRLRHGAVVLAAGTAMAVSLMARQASAQTWNSTSNGNVSDGSKWLGGVPPVSAPTTVLMLAPAGVGAAVTATVDGSYVSPLVVNSLTFANTRQFTLAASVGVTIQLAGASPTINLSGWPGWVNTPSTNLVNMSIVSAPIEFAADTTIGGSGIGNLMLTGVRTDDGTARTLTVPALPAALTTTLAGKIFHTVCLGGSWVGDSGSHLVLDGGNIQINKSGSNISPTALGPVDSTFHVTSAGGVLQFAPDGGALTSIAASTIKLDGTLELIGGGGAGAISVGAETRIKGAGTLAWTGSANTLVLNSDSQTAANPADNFTGAIVIDKSNLPMMNNTPGSITLAGVSGAVASSSVTVGGGGQFNLTSSSTTINNNRVLDSTPINLRSGFFSLTGVGDSFTNFNETVGVISAAGNNVISATSPTGGFVSTLTAAALTRLDRAGFIFRGLATTADRGQIVFSDWSANPGSVPLVGGGGGTDTTTISILPFAIGDANAIGNGTSLVTYDAATGVRALSTTTEFATALPGGLNNFANVRLTASTAMVSATETINALVLASAGAVTGAGTLNVGTGLIFCAVFPSNGKIDPSVAFGSREGHIFLSGATQGVSQLTVNGQLSGTNGLTKSGGGILKLTNDNSGLTGQLTLNCGQIDFNNNLALPGAGTIIAQGAGIFSNNGASGLTYSGTAAPGTISRNIEIKGGLLNLACASGAQPYTVSGQVSGAGGLCTSLPTGTHLYLTNTSNSYTGPTWFNSPAAGTGTVHIPSDAVLGNGGAVNLLCNLTLDGDWISSRWVNIPITTLTITLDTGTHDATFNGPVTGYTNALAVAVPSTGIVFTKIGAGTLTLNNYFTSATGLSINVGTLAVNGTISPSDAKQVTLNTGTTLKGTGTIYRSVNINTGATLAPGNSAGVLTLGRDLNFQNGSTYAVELNGATAGNGAGNYDRCVVSGAVQLSGASLSISLGYLPSATDKFFILTSENGITGTFASLSDGATVNLGSFGGGSATATISYQGDVATGATTGGNDVVLHNLQVIRPRCNAADVAGLGSTPGPDQQLTVDDIVFYLSQFFANNVAVADIIGLGGSPALDGVVTVDDLVHFLSQFFSPCN